MDYKTVIVLFVMCLAFIQAAPNEEEADFLPLPKQQDYAEDRLETSDTEQELAESDYFRFLRPYSRVYGRTVYLLSRHTMSFRDAELYCHTKGGEIAWRHMKTPSQRRQITRRFPRQFKAWMVVRYFNRKWMYPNYTRISKSFGWARGEPNLHHSELCTENYYNSNTVNNIPCSFKRVTLCEIPYRKSCRRRRIRRTPYKG